MATTPKERFDAAVKVIHSLPKDGPFQPSYDMMLTFYGLYKQATEGKCTKAKPWSWDIVAKKKWDAWNKLGSLAAEVAMDQYVDELKKSIAMSTDKWKTMGEKDKRIVEAMPQEKPVRDFMETIGTFYELIDEKSPFEDEKQTYERTKGDGHVIQADFDLHNGNDGDMNRSLMVDPILKNMVKEDAKCNGIAHGLQDKDFEDNVEMESSLSLLDSERENWDKISSQKLSRDQYVNGDLNGHYSDEEQTETDNTEIQIQRHNRENSETLYDNIQHPTNVDILANDQLASDKILPNERVTTESESEEEFCDTSDQPSPEDLYKPSSRGQQMSTPLKGSDNRHDNRPKNRVHFSDNPSLRTDAEINQQTFSPIPQQLQQRTDFSLSRNFPFGLNFSQNSPHDSMIVHGPTQDSLNVTGFSELDDSIVISNSSAQSDRNENSERSRKCGGGQLSPPGGGSGQKVPSQGYYSSQGFRQGVHDQGYGYYDGLPSERGQRGGGQGGQDPLYPQQFYGSVNDQISLVLLRLQQDMHTVLMRLESLEIRQKNEQTNSIWNSRWWPFPSLTGRTFLFVIIWPIIVHWFLSRRKRER